MADKNIEVINISKKSRVISALSIVIPFFIGYLLGADSKEEVAFWAIIALVSFWLSSYIFKRGIKKGMKCLRY